MAENTAPDPHALLREYGITFDPPSSSNEWPSTQRRHFEIIRQYCNFTFDTYSASVDIRSLEEPWKKSTKNRANHLAARATQLFKQDRNEEDWRMNLENDVLRRFMVEVACPKCRARLWRSEIEAAISETDPLAAQLAERRTNRMPCHCPPEERLMDYYEIGTNPLFDERSEHLIMHDPPHLEKLPERKPDRIFGLSPTRNLQRELSKLEHGNIEETLRSSPFRKGPDPLLFPFLILEAKSSTSSNGFYQSQDQTAFPIYALLKLQQGLRSRVQVSGSEEIPLVWFFANRGEQWRVYACVVSNHEMPEYHIIQLWDGCIMDRDKALQLILITDYIFDWARDIYRPAILTLLKAITTGQRYDQISLTDDSDVRSTMRYVSDWIQPPPDPIGMDIDAELEYPVVTSTARDHRPPYIPNTALGSLRSASSICSRLVGVCIGILNVHNWLEQAATDPGDISGPKKEARKLVSFLTCFDEVLVLSGKDVRSMEMIWSGKSEFEDETSGLFSETKFYFLAEFSVYMDKSWNIVRQMTYLAISQDAFQILVECASYRKHPRIENLPQVTRLCGNEAFAETIECLQAGSTDQIFMRAVECTSVSLYSMPERKRSDYTPETETLGFGTIRRPRVLRIVRYIHKAAAKKSRASRTTHHRKHLSDAERKEYVNSVRRKGIRLADARTKDHSFIRTSTGSILVLDANGHSARDCPRCRRFRSCGGKDSDNAIIPSESVFSAYGMSLVLACDRIYYHTSNFDICLFVSNDHPEIHDDHALAVVVADLLQAGAVYHTIRPTGNDEATGVISWRDQLWNLPRPYRPATPKERSDILAWVDELSGIRESDRQPSPGTEGNSPNKKRHAGEDWDDLQLLLHFLTRGQSYIQALVSIQATKSRSRPPQGVWNNSHDFRDAVYTKADEDEKQMTQTARCQMIDRGGSLWLQEMRSLRGDVDEPNLRRSFGDWR